MQLNQKLNLVTKIERVDGPTLHVHATPISREVFEANYLVIAKTFTRLYAEGLGVMSGPRVALYVLREVAREMKREAEVEASLVNEVFRLTNVNFPDERGWSTLPLETAVNRQILTRDEAGEVENLLIFFTCASWMHLQKMVPVILAGAGSFWGARVTSLSSTEFRSSLPTLSETAPSTAPAALSVPS